MLTHRALPVMVWIHGGGFTGGAAHSTELQYVFGKIPYLNVTPPFTTAWFGLSAQMIGYWTRFAATGNPNGGGAPYRPQFSSARQLTGSGLDSHRPGSGRAAGVGPVQQPGAGNAR